VTPLERYQQDCVEKQLRADPAQQQAVRLLDALYHQLLQPPKFSLWQRLRRQSPAPVRGIYLWGGVGRGKSYLADLFYDALPFGEKRRVHFHRFMQQIHQALKLLPKSPDPLEIVAKKIAAELRVLCLDEFHVSDIADAMLLSGLLKALFANGVTLVTSSNIPIHALYKNGLQRERFLPAIGLLQHHTQEFNLDGGTDYRLNLLEKSGSYHTPLDDQAAQALQQQFASLVTESPQWDLTITVNNREIVVKALAGEVIWFDFPQLCQTPRSATDYLEIARCYPTVLISDIPKIHHENDGVTKRFIDLIDALYDHHVKLIASADVPAEQIYLGERLAFPFQRTVSRLQEMRSHRYLSQPHIA